MKKTRKLLSWFFCLTLLLSLCITPMAGAEEEITLVLMSGDVLGGDERQLPQDEWLISKLLRKFEAENPGVKVELQVPGDTGAYHTTFKAAAATGNAPDVANLWSGMNILSFKDQLLCLNDYIPEEDMMLFETATAVRDNLSVDGDIYAYPFISKNGAFMLYNKRIIAEAGLDFETNPPLTMEAFYAACDAIKAAGYTPIWEDQGGQLFDYGVALWWQQGQAAENIVKAGKGELKMADDTALIEALEAYRALFERGYVNPDPASCPDKGLYFNNGEAAMIANGTWAIEDTRAVLGDDLGVMHFPDINDNAIVSDTSLGGIGETLCIPKTCKHPELAVKLCSFLNNRENSLEILKLKGGSPLRSDITAEDLGWENDPIWSKILGWSQKQLFSFPPAIVGTTGFNTLNGMAVKVLTGEMTPVELAQMADENIEMQ